MEAITELRLTAPSSELPNALADELWIHGSMAKVDKLSKQVECTKAELHSQQGNISRHQGQLSEDGQQHCSRLMLCRR